MLIDDIKNGENDRLEFKERPNDQRDKWLKTVVAFANCRRGRVLFGVGDDRKVIGLDGDLFAMKDSYMNVIEDWGSGIPRILEQLQKAGLKDLVIEDWPNAVRAILLPSRVGGTRGHWEIVAPKSSRLQS